MAVAFDVFTAFTAGTGSLGGTHTPVGTPKGVLVHVLCDAGSDQVTTVTYGGVNVPEAAGSPNVLSGGEGGSVYTYFLGSGIPTGAQTVAVSVSGAANKQAVCFTYTADTDTEIVDIDATINSTSLANPSVTLSLASRIAACSLVFFSGQNDIFSSTQLSGWTNRLEVDVGTESAGVYSYDTVASADVTAGWTQTAEDAAMIALAVSEVAAATAIFTKNQIARQAVKRASVY